MTSEKNFGKYIEKLRREQGFSIKNLCEGVCDETFFHRIENGEREAGKLVQDRVLERLGIAPENYESFLCCEEYNHWQKRQKILQHFRRGHLEETHRLLEQYQRKYGMKNPLERQFVLMLTAYIKRYEGVSETEIGALFKEAAELTICDIEQQPKDGEALSVSELDLIVEYIRYFKQGNQISAYLQLLDYLEKSNFAKLAQAKCIPKVIYYLYLAWKKENVMEIPQLLFLCNEAIELLGKTSRSFYLCELLRMKKELLQMEKAECHGSGSSFPKEQEKELEDCREFLTIWEDLCREWKQPVDMFDCSYIYVDLEAYCIEDVIRIRRKMLGMSMKELSEGICDERTVSRLENKRCRPQRAVVRCLFERLGISTELCKREFVSDAHDVLDKALELKTAVGEKNAVRAMEILNYLKQQKEAELPVNKQYILRYTLLVDEITEEIPAEEKILRLKEALECTIAYDMIMQEGEKYLTNGEIACIQNMIIQMKGQSSEKLCLMNTLAGLYEMRPCIEGYAGMYFFVMKTVASHWGNQGEFAKSDAIEKKLVETGFTMYRMHFLHKSLYALLWNAEQKQNAPHSMTKQRNAELKKCLKIAEFCKEYKMASFYTQRLQDEED